MVVVTSQKRNIASVFFFEPCVQWISVDVMLLLFSQYKIKFSLSNCVCCSTNSMMDHLITNSKKKSFFHRCGFFSVKKVIFCQKWNKTIFPLQFQWYEETFTRLPTFFYTYDSYQSFNHIKFSSINQTVKWWNKRLECNQFISGVHVLTIFTPLSGFEAWRR